MTSGVRPRLVGARYPDVVNMHAMRGIVVAFVVAILAGAFLANVTAGAPPRATIRVYANDVVWASFDAADFKPAPAESLDRIFMLVGEGLIPVAEASPGDPEYNGGRWEVHMVRFVGMAPTQFTNDEDLWYHASLGHLEIGEPVRYFECPLLRV